MSSPPMTIGMSTRSVAIPTRRAFNDARSSESGAYDRTGSLTGSIGPILPPDERLVEKLDERGDRAEYLQHARVELGAGRERGGIFTTCEKLTEFQILNSRVVRIEAARHALQLLALELADGAHERRRFDDGAEAAMIRRNVLALRVELRCVRTVQAAADPHILWAHVQVEGGALMLAEPQVRKDGRDVRFERRFVVREAGVAIDPIQRNLRAGRELRRERAE